MIIIVTGERDWPDKAEIFRVLDELLDGHTRSWFSVHPKESLELPYDQQLARALLAFVVRHGKSGNADTWANEWGIERGVTIERFQAEWREGGQYNPAAGPIRNRKMAEALPQADLCAAFWSGVMRKRESGREFSGTLDMIKQALQHQIPVRIFPPRSA